MNKEKRNQLGILAFWPIIFVIILGIMSPEYFINGIVNGDLGPYHSAFIVLSPFVILVTLAYLLVHAYKNKHLQRKKILWILFIIIGNIFAMPAYWYLHIRKH